MRAGQPPRKFKYLEYLGTIGQRRISSKSQYVPNLELPCENVILHSQIGEAYTLAQLGKLDEQYDRLAKYDTDHLPLNREIAQMALNRFLDPIGPCYYLDHETAFSDMDKTKSIGFGAREQHIFSRSDPQMKNYLFEYVKRSAVQTYQVIITASQKDEIRVSNKTPRLFTSFPPEHTFLATIVLGDFQRQFIERRFTTSGSPSAVGDSLQKGALVEYRRQLEKFPYVYCTDTSAQDSSVTTEFLHMFYDSVKTKFELDEEDDNFFEAVRHNSIYKLLNVNGDFYLVPRGLGSGDYCTIIINVIWRYYLLLENYNHNLETFEQDNVVIINGDDLIMSSRFPDLNLDSKYAEIKWEKRPNTWSEMDFCSLKFEPYIHHDPTKVLAVYNLRRKRDHLMSPKAELQRLGGLLRVLSTPEIYDLIHNQMIKIVINNPELQEMFECLFISYEDLYNTYNTFEFGD
jgi:hypothetical protein